MSLSSFLQRTALKFGVVLVMLSFQINLLAETSPPAYVLFYASLLISVLVVIGGRVSPGILVLLVLTTLATAATGNPLKGLGLGLGACFGYRAVRDYERHYLRVMYWILIVNIVVAAIQFLGVWEAAYNFAYYPNDAYPIPVTDESFGVPAFVPQFRPSGIFPSTTFVSAYSVLLFTTVLITPSHGSRFASLASGLFLALLGSSVGLFLAGCAALLMWPRRSLRYVTVAYALAMAAYLRYLPSQFAYNFSVADILNSFALRFDLSDLRGESVVQNSAPAVIALIVVGIIFWMVAVRFGSFSLLVAPGLVLVTPVLVHNITLTLFYWFMIGAVTARLESDGRLRELAARLRRGKRRLGHGAAHAAGTVLGAGRQAPG